MRVEKHVLSILYQSGEARDSSGMRYIKLQGCLEFYNSIMATDFHFPPNFQRIRRRMTQSSIDKPLPRLHTLWCDPHGG